MAHKVIVAWCTSNAKNFEEQVPLHFVGKRNQQLGLGNGINVLFLQGYNALDKAYKSSLIELGYTLHDTAPLYDYFEKKYRVLDRFGDYEKKCFLRWLVMDQFFEGDPLVHFDGDIVFNESPDVIAQRVAQKTFILQGCPAFAALSNRTWFEQYRASLHTFTKNIDAYSAAAWQQREGWEVTFKTRWAGSRFREIITSDQDFLSHLIHTGQIMQDPVEEIMFALRDYIYFENPLFVHQYDENLEYRYKRDQGIDYFEFSRIDDRKHVVRKKILFWHMQSCFTFYLSKRILRRKLVGPFPLGRIPLYLGAQNLFGKFNKFMSRFMHHTSRLHVYRYYFEQHDFSGIFKSKVWWKNGVFK